MRYNSKSKNKNKILITNITFYLFKVLPHESMKRCNLKVYKSVILHSGYRNIVKDLNEYYNSNI